jgi:hypothetical protein
MNQRRFAPRAHNADPCHRKIGEGTGDRLHGG